MNRRSFLALLGLGPLARFLGMEPEVYGGTFIDTPETTVFPDRDLRLFPLLDGSVIRGFDVDDYTADVIRRSTGIQGNLLDG